MINCKENDLVPATKQNTYTMNQQQKNIKHKLSSRTTALQKIKCLPKAAMKCLVLSIPTIQLPFITTAITNITGTKSLKPAPR